MIQFEMMMEDEAVKMNLDLLNEFMKYAFDHPDVLDDIPADAELVILPTDDPVLYNENKTTVDSLLKEGKNQELHSRRLNCCQPEEESLLI